jgi:hypothetical protein
MMLANGRLFLAFFHYNRMSLQSEPYFRAFTPTLETTLMTRTNRPLLFALIAVCSCAFTRAAIAQVSYLYADQPGKADVRIEKDTIVLKNAMLIAQWQTDGGKLRAGSFGRPDAAGGQKLLGNAFTLVFANGQALSSASMSIVGSPRLEKMETDDHAARMAEHSSGKRAVVQLEDLSSKINVVWSVALRDGDNYIRQEISISGAQEIPIREVRLFDFALPGAHVVGYVKGSPVVAADMFLGFEHPQSLCVVEDHVRCSIPRELPLKAGQTVTYSSVLGISRPDQMRRGFLNYLERERAHPYRPFLHYNSWFDIGFGNLYNQSSALDAINAIGQQLHGQRGVKLDSFLFDDGWDDPRSLWSFNSGFPDGFTPLKEAAARYGAAPGIWLSPWGGYSKAKMQRLQYGAKQGFETNKGGFALSGPKYFARFRQVTLDFVREYGINQFKIDGTGNVNSVFPGSEFDSDFQAAIRLIGEWRAVKPDIFVNLTTGTYPSPFWLRYADSIWRGGDDTNFAGVGSRRERWITYRDAATYAGVVKKGPLFPLNSLMLHGIVYAKNAPHLATDPSHAFTHEVRSYFGTGTQLQELYITHALMSDRDWDVLAESAKWSRSNASLLADTHWIGGDPAKLQVYGWAAWSPAKGIITLRNPSNRSRTFSLDVSRAFELPPGSAKKYTARSPWHSDQDTKPLSLTAGEPYTVHLRPFEVVNLELSPVL